VKWFAVSARLEGEDGKREVEVGAQANTATGLGDGGTGKKCHIQLRLLRGAIKVG